MAETEAGEGKDAGWRTTLDVVWRLLLIFLGIPAVWVLRAYGVLDLSIWQAIVGSALLLAIAVGDAMLAMTLSA
ncbi:Uncharacterised protein [Mycobacteroides abscessus subsp. abscessus]|uniref:hypothetical protein n=1 Tax=Mycobacteroides abscessus TaxID=36809 RepID=UPI0009288B22|nr:hypothetical protein [Mycobacteroides abscessus]SIJ22467.1 Uncharacterised protein [Mycobacteroides abscessus subsp. abscessus]SLH38294.1 Uncharacterised protein [Mycobacteroides abscessus subsp. abscessus]